MQALRERIRVRRDIDREPLGHVLVAEPLALANRGLRQHPRADALRTGVGRLVARQHRGIGRIQPRHAIAERGLGAADDLTNHDPVRGLRRRRVRADADLLDAERLAADVAQRLFLAGHLTQPLVPRPAIRVPEHVPEAHAIRLRPEGGLTGEPRHLLLVVLILQRQLLGLRLALVVRVLRGRRHREAGALVHENLQALVKRLVDHVVHDARGIPRPRRFPPGSQAVGRNPLLAGPEEAVPLHEVQVHLHRLAPRLPQATGPARPRRRILGGVRIRAGIVCAIEGALQRGEVFLRRLPRLLGRIGRDLLVRGDRVIAEPGHRPLERIAQQFVRIGNRHALPGGYSIRPTPNAARTRFQSLRSS